MSFDRLVSLITSGSLYFSRADAFEDHWEGWYPDQFTSPAYPESIRYSAAWNRANFGRQNRSSHYFNCWHLCKHESYLMWKAYAAAGRGVAIRSTVGHLISSVKSCSDRVHIGQVLYLDPDNASQISTSSILPHFFIKRADFSSEQELRVMIHRISPLDEEVEAIQKGSILPVNNSFGLRVPVDLSELLQGIVLAPQMYKEWAEPLRILLKSSGLGESLVERSRLEDSHPYEERLMQDSIRSQHIQSFEEVSTICCELLGPLGESLSCALRVICGRYRYQNEEISSGVPLDPRQLSQLKAHLEAALDIVKTSLSNASQDIPSPESSSPQK